MLFMAVESIGRRSDGMGGQKSYYFHGTAPDEQARPSRLNDLLNERSPAFFDACIARIRSWGERPDAAPCYGVSWAEGRRPRKAMTSCYPTV
jgi:hypothetical protein